MTISDHEWKMSESECEFMNEYMNKWMDEWTNEKMIKQTNESAI